MQCEKYMCAGNASRAGANFVIEPTAATDGQPASAVRQAEAVKESLGEMWLAMIYRERILPMRTRSHHLDVPSKETSAEVQHTLLGVELKVGRRRMLCPDLATARYLAVFARAGCADVAVPYDITHISRLADELESSWHRMLLLMERACAARSSVFRSRVRALLVGEVRNEVRQAGAGTAIPKFNQNTKQRPASVKA
jgi:hypothetical protein